MAEAPDTSDKRLEELEEEITCAVCRGHYMPRDGLCITGTPGYWGNGFIARESSFG